MWHTSVPLVQKEKVKVLKPETYVVVVFVHVTWIYNRNTSNICSALHRVYVTSNTVSSSRIRTTKRQAYILVLQGWLIPSILSELNNVCFSQLVMFIHPRIINRVLWHVTGKNPAVAGIIQVMRGQEIVILREQLRVSLCSVIDSQCLWVST